jgi:hypothetical protein
MTMTTLVIVALLVACGYLFTRMYAMRAENASLRVQVASLKKQIARMRG